eukprot:TRINITY_DN22243_c0_g1_i4.p1 TRINITY_DN22243_c0_g1~~TRINITY_DN22243_c0_g1_i4.p1  ORF type:complete len:376 (-),score=66.07 TRINITY_DN22243_c0_g1_i4:72-1199(-)
MLRVAVRRLCRQTGVAAAADDALVRRVNAAFAAPPQYAAEHEQLRQFWRDRFARMRTEYRPWSIMEIVRAIFARKKPVKATILHGIFCTSLTIPFVHLQQDRAAELPLLHPFMEHLTNHSELFQGSVGFLATALFLLLSFRVNRASDRWHEGSRLYADVMGSLKALTFESQVYSKDRRFAVDVGVLSYAYARAVEMHLRGEGNDKLAGALKTLLTPQQLEQCLAAPHRPHFLGSLLSKRLSDEYLTGALPVRAAVALQSQVNRLTRAIDQMHRIQSTPEPWSVQKHIKFTILVWLGALPVALLPGLLWATPPSAMCIAYVVFKLEDISIEIQNPFTLTRSDLNLCMLNDELHGELHASLLTYVQNPGLQLKAPVD